MTRRNIVAIGFELASDDAEELTFDSKQSLLDFDIVLFRPDIEDTISYDEVYQGRPSLSDSQSFKLKESAAHWRREIREMLDAGKTVIVFLCERVEVMVATGTVERSGTGRNQRTIRHVMPFANYQALMENFARLHRRAGR